MVKRITWIGVREALRVHRARIEGAALFAVLLFIAVGVGTAAFRRAAALNAEANRLERVQSTAEVWRRGYRAPSAAEMLAWQRAGTEMSQLALREPRRLELLRLVAQRAEEVGVPEARVRIVPVEQLGSIPPREADTLVIASADYGLSAEFTAPYESALALLEALPTALAPLRLEMRKAANGVAVRLLIAVYTVETDDANPGEMDSAGIAHDGGRAGGAGRTLGGGGLAPAGAGGR